MRVLDTLFRLLVGEASPPASDVRAALESAYAECVTRTAQLKRHADMAPQRYSLQALRELAEAEQEQCDRLRSAIEAAAGVVPSVVPKPWPPSGANHWTRLAQDLESHRLSVQLLRELAMRFAEPSPQAAALFGALCDEEINHCRNLRNLIARADPQALD